MGTIYCLYFESDDNKYYIGQSINTPGRYTKHKRLLLTNTHTNSKLQEAYNKYKYYPSIYLLEKNISNIELDNREVFWIKEFDSYYNGFNSTPGGKYYEFGENLIASRKYPEYVYVNILFDLVYTDNSSAVIAEENGVLEHTVSSIRQLASHNYLEDTYPEEYAILKNKANVNSSIKYDTTICAQIFTKVIDRIPYKDICQELSVPYTLVTSIAYGLTHKNELLNIFGEELYTNTISIRDKTTSNRKNKYPNICDPQGNIHIVTVANHLAKKYSLDPSSLAKVLNGKLKQYKGWKLDIGSTHTIQAL